MYKNQIEEKGLKQTNLFVLILMIISHRYQIFLLLQVLKCTEKFVKSQRWKLLYLNHKRNQIFEERNMENHCRTICKGHHWSQEKYKPLIRLIDGLNLEFRNDSNVILVNIFSKLYFLGSALLRKILLKIISSLIYHY